MSLYLSISCYILINQSHLADLERPKRFIFSCKCSFKSRMVFERASSLGTHSAVPWKTIDILSDWAANSKSQLDLLKSGLKLTYFKNRKRKKKKREGEEKT